MALSFKRATRQLKAKAPRRTAMSLRAPPACARFRSRPMSQATSRPCTGPLSMMMAAAATRRPCRFAYGAMGMAREEYDADSASSQWFWLLFDSDLTPAGKNLLDGRYTCFGYTTKGARLLSDVKEGDVIVSAKVVSGYENLVLPKGQEVAADAEEGA